VAINSSNVALSAAINASSLSQDAKNYLVAMRSIANNPSATRQQMCIDKVNAFKAVNACVLQELADTVQKMMIHHFECAREREEAASGSTHSTPAPGSFPTRPPPVNCTNGCPDLRSAINATAICDMMAEMAQKMSSHSWNGTHEWNGTHTWNATHAWNGTHTWNSTHVWNGTHAWNSTDFNPAAFGGHNGTKDGEMDGHHGPGGPGGPGGPEGAGMCPAGGAGGMGGGGGGGGMGGHGHNPCSAFGHKGNAMHNQMHAGHMDDMNKHFHDADHCGCPGVPPSAPSATTIAAAASG